jgi:hypothetical protein
MHYRFIFHVQIANYMYFYHRKDKAQRYGRTTRLPVRIAGRNLFHRFFVHLVRPAQVYMAIQALSKVR